MARHSDFTPSSNLEEFKQRLSPFGQRIFNVLVENWNKERLVRSGGGAAAAARRGTPLAFTETDISDTPPLQSTHQTNFPRYQHNINNEKQFSFELEPINLVSVSTANQLLQYRSEQQGTDRNEKNETCNIIRLDLLNSVGLDHSPDPNNSRRTNSVRTNVVKSANLQDDKDFPLNLNDDNTNNISWLDMFDTELLPKAIEKKTKKQCDVVQRIDKNESIEIHFPQDINTKKKSKSSNDNILKTNKEFIKRKQQENNIDDIPKKIKKTLDDKKLAVRKQTYTKSVKKWLDNVDVSNADVIESDALIKNIHNDKPPKRVVQMQLANKQGKMKYGRPKDLDNSIKKHTIISPLNKVAAETDNKATNNDRLKKGEASLVPAVKSQLPVKDITYQICIIDSTNVDHRIPKIRGDRGEICAVLVYSNNFCQLNSQYTEDDCVPEGIMLYMNNMFYYFKKTEMIFSGVVGQVLEHNTIVCYDGKSLLVFLKSQFEFNIQFDINDIQIGASLLDPDNPPESFADLQKLLAVAPQYTIATECVLQKTAWYATLLSACAGKLKASLAEEALWNVFVDIEMRLLPVVADMEMRGILVDVAKLKEMETTLLCRMRSVERECHQAAGKIFQVNSAAQVRTILYDELQLDSKCNIKIRETLSKGVKSTSETMLRELVTEHPLPKLILEYRRLHKAHATFLNGVAQHVRDGIIRPTWVQAAAATGRVACNNPNVQAIPKAPFSLLPEGSDGAGGPALNLRAVYVSRARHVLLAADFKHVECRVFAHAAADTLLLHALHAGQDLFTVLAAKWEQLPVGGVSPAARERTKRVVYASLYGAGARTLMDILRVSYERALQICASFHRTFPSLKSFGRAVVARCADNGGRLTTAAGRVRRLRHVTSSQPALRSQAERQAVNFLVQDLCKMAMVRATERLQQGGVLAWLLLQIHDELVWEVAEADLLRAAAVIKEVMENCGHECGMAIPLPVALSTGRSWGEMTELQLAE